nr:unnamed protein product [Callosobruchus chinensis]
MSVLPPVRKRSREMDSQKPKTFSVYYYFPCGKETFRVCRSFLSAVFNVKKGRLRSVARTLSLGNVPKETRGGRRLSNINETKKQNVRDFLNRLPACESHYNRQKSKRVYLAADLNIATLHRMYNTESQSDLHVTLSMFKRLFYSEFNIGFSSPASDVCGTCLNLKNAIKKDNEDRLKTELKVHQIRANTFYKLMGNGAIDAISICFDLQQVHPLPKTPIQDAFYKRQISFYTFCCVDVKSRFPVFYTWKETEGGRGATEIGSALLCHLRSLEIEDSITKIRLFCDGCGGKNKNSHIIHLLTYWLKKEAPPAIKTIILHFPVRGHSFLPADRVFGRAEKVLKRHTVIVNPEEYNELYKKIGEVKRLGKEWDLFDIKGLSEIYNKVSGIKDFKRCFIKKSVYNNGTPFYRFADGVSSQVTLLKRGKRDNNFRVKKVPLGNDISEEKKENVKYLLDAQFNKDNVCWEREPQFEFYKKVFGLPSVEPEEDEEDEDQEQCDCLEPERALHV